MTTRTGSGSESLGLLRQSERSLDSGLVTIQDDESVSIGATTITIQDFHEDTRLK
eukprot:m.2879 g.2879  ORF g.2879 m.2879 type:complete len:55 (-) comp3238_c0_seq1:113-277(-)